jgi:hypothetical protein
MREEELEDRNRRKSTQSKHESQWDDAWWSEAIKVEGERVLSFGKNNTAMAGNVHSAVADLRMVGK